MSLEQRLLRAECATIARHILQDAGCDPADACELAHLVNRLLEELARTDAARECDGVGETGHGGDTKEAA